MTAKWGQTNGLGEEFVGSRMELSFWRSVKKERLLDVHIASICERQIGISGIAPDSETNRQVQNQ
jgi:hypothetical protein